MFKISLRGSLPLRDLVFAHQAVHQAPGVTMHKETQVYFGLAQENAIPFSSNQKILPYTKHILKIKKLCNEKRNDINFRSNNL